MNHFSFKVLSWYRKKRVRMFIGMEYNNNEEFSGLHLTRPGLGLVDFQQLWLAYSNFVVFVMCFLDGLLSHGLHADGVSMMSSMKCRTYSAVFH